MSSEQVAWQEPHTSLSNVQQSVLGVWCREFSISLPEKIEALNGCSVIIKCTFEINNTLDKDLTESATGVWYKDGHGKKKIAFNSSIANPNPIIRGNISGKLHEKDCTTIFYDVSSNHNGKYYFRIEGNGGLKYTYKTASVAINVIDSPHNPTVKLYVDQKEVQSQQVLEGSSVSLSCSAETLCSSPPATLTWSSTPRLPFSLEEQQSQTELISHLNFTATHLQHTITFTCTVTYQLQNDNKTAHSNLTLHVTYAPKISLSSSCNRTDVTDVCLCEVDGNPSPKLEWHLSGRPVTNSTNSSISEERLSSTVLRSFITLHHSLTHTSTVQCVTTNTHGTATQLFQWLFYAQESTGINNLSVLIGAAVGVLVVMIWCGITHIYARRGNRKPSQTRGEGTLRVVLTDEAGSEENEEETIYANKLMLTPVGASTLNCPESLHNSSTDFTNTILASCEIRCDSSLAADYAAVLHPTGVTKSSMGGDKVDPQRDQNILEREIKTSGVQAKGVFSGARQEQVIMNTREVKSKQSNEELLTNSGEASQLYAQVKRCNP
ncbi:sialic acid-binding Ig-like lectin 14 [Myxocyprinus asiaticus]|uniref:sialic acid-binding Ig-like lectin 14 n=1 Tax=Myxocyprinus asiaticus TaxID=70543 RepID=UPI002221DC7F|nr:sialic acid-binding Ig-like lectin 14 [Myxocyprinus asiaticus]